MKCVADENVDSPIVTALGDAASDVWYVAEEASGITDDEVLQKATSDAALLLTGDKDFGNLVFLQGRASAGVLLLRLAGVPAREKAEIVILPDIRHMVTESHDQGVLGKTEAELIHSVFEFSKTPVKKVMVPRPNVFALDVGTPPEEVLRGILDSGFSRVPVYEETVDNTALLQAGAAQL